MKQGFFLLLLSLLTAASAHAVWVKPCGSRVEIYGNSGSYRGSISCNGVRDAQADDRLIAVLLENGRVELYTTEGSYKSSFTANGGYRLQVSNGCVAVTLSSGRTEIYDNSGSYCGSF